MLRALVTAVLLCACDESDPSTSEHCVMVRMRWIEIRYARDRAAEVGVPTDISDRALAQLVNENWQCFK